MFADQQGNILEANDCTSNMTGYTQGDLTGKPVSFLLHREDAPKYEELIHGLGREGFGDSSFRMTSRNGKMMEVECRAGCAGDGTIVFIFHDVTPRKKRERELQQRNREAVALYEIGREITSTFDTDQLLNAIVTNAMWVLECHVAGVGLHDNVSSPVSWKSVIGNRTADFLTPVGRLLSSTIPVVLQRLPGDTRLEGPALQAFLKEDLVTVLGVPLSHKGHFFGTLVCGFRHDHPFTDDEIRLISSVAGQAAVALENLRMYQSTRDHADKLTALSSKLTYAQERERRKVSRDLHEGLGQVLSGIRFHLQILSNDLHGPGLERIQNLTSIIDETLGDINEMAFDLRPSALDDFGLASALHLLISRFTEKTRIPVRLEGEDCISRWDKELEETLYRVIQEALDNIAEHSKATEATLRFVREGRTLSAHISDNGIGYDAGQSVNLGERIGIFGMRERIHRLQGTFAVQSSPGEGVHIHIQLPLR